MVSRSADDENDDNDAALLENENGEVDIASRHQCFKFDFALWMAIVFLEMVSLWYTDDHAKDHYDIHCSSATWYPVNNCALPPQQPFYIDTALAMSKTFLIAFAFGRVVIEYAHVEVSWVKWATTWSLGIYQILIIPLSLGLSTYAFSMMMGKFNSSFEAYQCAGAIAMSGPWTLTLLTAIVQYYLTGRLLKHCRDWVEGEEDDMLWSRGAGGVTDRKVTLLKTLLITVVVLYGGVLSCFCISHILPGLVVYSPFTVPILGSGYSLTRYISGFEMLSRLEKKGVDGARRGTLLAEAIAEKERCNAEETKVMDWRCNCDPMEVVMAANAGMRAADAQAAKEKEADRACEEALESARGFQWALLRLLPMILAIKVVVIVSYLSMVNLYSGQGWLQSISTVLTERQVGVYADNFREKILGQYWQAVNLLGDGF